ncbi:unnamed protein product [Ophioblennius macclurei]
MFLPVSLLICLSVVRLCSADQPVEEIITSKKAHVTGGWVDVDPEMKEIQEAARVGVEKFNANSRSKMVFKLESVENAKTQVTNVINFKFDAILVKTKCLKSDNHDVNSCGLKKVRMNCHFIVSVDPRTEKYEKVNSQCTKQRAKA